MISRIFQLSTTVESASKALKTKLRISVRLLLAASIQEPTIMDKISKCICSHNQKSRDTSQSIQLNPVYLFCSYSSFLKINSSVFIPKVGRPRENKITTDCQSFTITQHKINRMKNDISGGLFQETENFFILSLQQTSI